MSGTQAPARRALPLVAVLGDAAAVLIAVAAVFVPRDFGGMAAPAPAPIALLAAALIALLLRRRAPRVCAAAAVLLTLGSLLVAGALAAQLIVVLVTVFTVGQRTTRRSTIVIAAAAILLIWTASTLVLGSSQTDLRASFQIVASIGFAAAAGDASRSRRAYIAAITDRARRAEETKEAEARRRVADERVAIARDLHDLVAHQIAVVSLNAGVASRAVRDRPADAERALSTIHDAAQTVLTEISGLLTVLRDSDDRDAAARLAPRPGLAQLSELLDGFPRSGLVVELRREGEPGPLPDAADVVAYLALQEALTNVLKHSGGEAGRTPSALVHLEYRPDAIALTVTNPVPPPRPGVPPEPRGGHGLDGVRERVASVRGRVDAGHGPGPVFRFTASLPLPRVDEPATAATSQRLAGRPTP